MNISNKRKRRYKKLIYSNLTEEDIRQFMKDLEYKEEPITNLNGIIYEKDKN